MMRLLEKHVGGWGLAFSLRTPHEYDEKDPHNLVNIHVGSHSYWFRVPEIIKPRADKVVVKHKVEEFIKFTGRDWYYNYTMRKYGVSFFPEAVHVYYGIIPHRWSRNDPKNSDHVKVLNYFWDYNHVRHSMYYADGRFADDGGVYTKHRDGYLRKKYNDVQSYADRHVLEFYDNVLYTSRSDKTSGVIYMYFKYTDPVDDETVVAKVNIEEMEWIRGTSSWMRRLLKYIKSCRMIKRYMNIEFFSETGDRKGSWKGGMIGTSFPMLHDETLYECFKRFQQHQYDNHNSKRRQ